MRIRQSILAMARIAKVICQKLLPSENRKRNGSVG